jgi:probable HAF family extracellular repeat protein
VKSTCCSFSLLLFVALCGLSPIAHGEPPPRYEVVYLRGSLNGSIDATAINNSGDIAGRFWAADLSIHAFLYRDGVVQDLPPAGGEAAYDYGFDLNDAGQFVGAFLGSFRGNPPLQTPPGFQRVMPTGLNNFGVIVGSAVDNAGKEVPFVYSNGVFTPLPMLSYGRYCIAWRVNNNGLIIGDSSDSNGRVFAVTYTGTNLNNLGTLPGDVFSSVTALNDSGHVVGVSAKLDQVGEITEARGFFYSQGRMTLLPTQRLFPWTYPTAINKQDQIVGFSEWVGANGETRQAPFLVSSGRIHDVNELLEPRKNPIHIQYVHDINDDGWMVGSGHDNVSYGAILLRPIGKGNGPRK